MLLPDSIHPELSIYYNGALVLKQLNQNKHQSIMSLYHQVTDTKHMSFSTFVLCLDWLYLIDAAKINAKGEVELCL